jgi:hypothetical protein
MSYTIYPWRAAWLIASLAALALSAACSEQEPAQEEAPDPRRGLLEAPSSTPGLHRFDKEKADLNAWSTPNGAAWSIKDGELVASGGRNKTLWLKEPIPPYVRIELEARALTPGGDIRLEVFGDGQRHESGYVLIFNAWSGTAHVVARLDEHAADRVLSKSAAPIEVGRTYKMIIIRTDRSLRWFVDGQLLIDYTDSAPLMGPGHEHFGLGVWKSQVAFDNIAIVELKGPG